MEYKSKSLNIPLNIGIQYLIYSRVPFVKWTF